MFLPEIGHMLLEAVVIIDIVLIITETPYGDQSK